VLRWESQQHPIEVLIRQSRRTFQESVVRQSTSLETAVVEYQRRYGREVWYLGFKKNMKCIDNMTASGWFREMV